MKIILLVEGDTERFLPPFFKRWLDPQTPTRVSIKPQNFKGVGDYRARFAKTARLYLGTPEVAGVIGVIDYHNSGLNYPPGTLAERCLWAKQQFENQVNDSRFYQHFAVHETEAWLLAQPGILPQDIGGAFKNAHEPEKVNSNHPPGKRLNDLYQKHLGKKCRKPTEGSTLFSKLDPSVAYMKCPHLKLLLDDLLALAQSAVK